MAKISIIGTGYVGLVTGVCFAELGNEVICVDIDEERVKQINLSIPPIYEKGLKELLEKNVKNKKIVATSDLRKAVMSTDISFICVGTPSGFIDCIDLKYVEEVSEDIGAIIKEKNYHIVVVKSTVVPGTTEHSVIPLLEKHSQKRAGKDFGVAMNPEFLREGNAIKDFLYPDRIVIGGIDEKSTDALYKLYKDFTCPILKASSPKTAEMIKYATNSFLVTKISFINEIGNICKSLGIDVYEVAEGLGMDSRVSPQFLNAGIGFGGSCFPKDVEALVGKAKEVYYRPIVLNAALDLNEGQALRLVELLEKKIGSLKGVKIVVLGLAFKPGTDDMREAPSIKIIHNLLNKGAEICATDPQAVEEAKKIFGANDRLKFVDSPEEAVKFGKHVLIVTEWEEFKNKALYKGKVVMDGRRIDEAKIAEYYEGVCW